MDFQKVTSNLMLERQSTNINEHYDFSVIREEIYLNGVIIIIRSVL